MLSANRVVKFLFPICIPFISTSCFIILAQNSKTMSNKSGESEYPSVIPDFGGNGLTFSSFIIMMALGL
jgi:hypothetical protein